MVAGVVQRDVAWSAWLIGAPGMLLVFVPSNQLCGGRAVPSRRDPSHVQTLTCNNLERACVDVGRPPGDLTAAGALGEPYGLRVGYHDDECGPRVPFQPWLAALPRAGSKPIDIVSFLPLEARGFAETWRHSLLRDPKEADLVCAELILLGLSQISHLSDALLDTVIFCIKPVRRRE